MAIASAIVIASASAIVIASASASAMAIAIVIARAMAIVIGHCYGNRGKGKGLWRLKSALPMGFDG